MWEAYFNNIYIIYLPAYTSYVLQPFNLLCFNVLKKAYHTHLKRLLINVYYNSSVTSKRAFFKYYRLARFKAFTESNIKVRWMVTGLWLINMVKPLRSKLLLRNFN